MYVDLVNLDSCLHRALHIEDEKRQEFTLSVLHCSQLAIGPFFQVEKKVKVLLSSFSCAHGREGREKNAVIPGWLKTQAERKCILMSALVSSCACSFSRCCQVSTIYNF